MKTITTRDFDRLLADTIDNDVFFLLSIPGVYQVLSEYYNDDVLAAWKTEHRPKTKPPEDAERLRAADATATVAMATAV